jgi:hypothetical protein
METHYSNGMEINDDTVLADDQAQNVIYRLGTTLQNILV